MSESGGPHFRRLLLALDAAQCGAADFSLVTDLAALLGAELEGLFVEDIDLIGLSALPFAREVGRRSGQDRPMERASVESALKRRIERAAGELERAGKRRNVPVTHRTARGKVVRQALAQGERGDVLMLRTPEDGRRDRAAQGGSVRRGPVMLWYEDSPAGMASCELALHLARRAGSGLVVGFLETPLASEAEVRRRLERVLSQAPGPVWLRALSEARADLLVDAARAARITQLVLSGEGPLVSEDSLEHLCALLGAGLILVR